MVFEPTAADTHRAAMDRASAWFRLPVFGKYLRWLEGGSPVGGVDRYPVVDEKGQTDIPGLHVAGDLTGIPLLKFAAEGGQQTVRVLLEDEGFQAERRQRPDDVYDLVIVGAGIAGLSAALSAQQAQLRFTVLESDRTFTTIRNFPKGKPIAAYPLEKPQTALLKIEGESKEELLDSLDGQIEAADLPIVCDAGLIRLSGRRGRFDLETKQGVFRALRVLLAIGKSGEAQKLGVEGEQLAKVQNRLIDPAAFQGQRVLVVGGGDSAVEAALLLAAAPETRVALSYRGASLMRPKPENIRQLEQARVQGRIEVLYDSKVVSIFEKAVRLQIRYESEPREMANDAVLVLIGRRLPLALFAEMGVSIEGTWTLRRKLLFACLFLFAAMLYFGKSAPAVTADTWVTALLRAPLHYFSAPWESAVLGVVAWLSALGFAVTGLAAAGLSLGRCAETVGSGWSLFKHLYFVFVGVFVAGVYVADDYAGTPVLDKSLGFWYTGLYSLTIVIFGVRRILVRRTRYIALQTSTLMAVQVLFLFLLPEFVFPFLGENGMLSDWVMRNLFPNGSYWRSYGFILAWPLFFSNLLYGHPTTIWLIISLVQSFVIIPYAIWVFGKGAYCGWICSCGGLAETLGDEYRKLAWHGPRARSLEHAGQVILLVVAVLTLWNLLAPWFMGSVLSATRGVYRIVVDVFLAGAVGVGVYFFMSGRVWCRFFCPLAALMHIYTRFSRYRIFSDKKKCISCGLCSRTCHMGIDVMNFANKGRPMDDYECVRCSACIVECPVECLSFGRIGGNNSGDGWATGR